MKAGSRQGIGLGIGWAIGIMLATGWARGGDLDSPAAPDQAASAMYTLNDLYNKLDTRASVSRRSGAFVEPTAGPTGGTMRTLNAIMDMANTRLPVPKTGQATSFGVGSDGVLKSGGTWPAPRFRVAAETGEATNCVVDNLTGLMWARDANLFGATNWADGLIVCNDLSYGGYSDWRMPNLSELRSLIAIHYNNPALCNTAGTAKHAAGNPFFNVKSGSSDYYWSSSTYMVSNGKAWPVSLYSGDSYPHNYGDKTYLRFVWPVRGPDL